MSLLFELLSDAELLSNYFKSETLKSFNAGLGVVIKPVTGLAADFTTFYSKNIELCLTG